ncbi:MAG: hypothetical protein ACRC1K_12215 [Planctomycetia bacterium]
MSSRPPLKMLQFGLLGYCIGSSAAHGQAVVPPRAAVTIQRPTVSVVSVQTTVVAPDGGGVSLGGLGGAVAGRSRFGGPFPGNTGGPARGARAGGVSSHVHIHDFEEMEAAMGVSPDRYVERTPPALTSVELLAKGKAAADKGKLKVARSFYQLAVKAPDAQARIEAARRLLQVNSEIAGLKPSAAEAAVPRPTTVRSAAVDDRANELAAIGRLLGRHDPARAEDLSRRAAAEKTSAKRP